MIRYSDNDATDALITQATVPPMPRVADQLGMTRTEVLGGTVFRSSTWWGHSTTTTRDLVRLMNHLVHRHLPLLRQPRLRARPDVRGDLDPDLGAG